MINSKIIRTASLVILLLSCSSPILYADSFTLNSFFPSPYGQYKKVQLVPRELIDAQDLGETCSQIGTLYIHEDTGQARFCKDDGTGTGKWGLVSGVWMQTKDATGQKMIFPVGTENHNGTADATNYYRVGIGTSEPAARGLTIHEPGMVVDYDDYTNADGAQFVLAASDPKMVLVCENETTGCASISFIDSDPNTGNTIDQWTIGNLSEDGWDVAGQNFFVIAYKPETYSNYYGMPAIHVMSISPDRHVALGNYADMVDPNPYLYNTSTNPFPATSLHILNDDGSTAIRLEERTGTDKSWELRSMEGGAGVDRFSIWGGYDGAETEQLVIDKDGKVGIGTTEPVARLHVKEGDNPAVLRLEGVEPTLILDESSAGDTTYRIRVNDGMLKIENDGEGYFLPSLTINDSGQVGFAPFRRAIDATGENFEYIDMPSFGQLAVGSDGHMKLSDASAVIKMIDDDPGDMDLQMVSWGEHGGVTFSIGPDFPVNWTGTWHHRLFSMRSDTGWLGFGNNSTGLAPYLVSYPLHFKNGAYLTTTGVTHDASSREYKEDINPLPLEESQKILEELQPVSFYNINDTAEQRLSFIAEDLPDLIAQEGRYGVTPVAIISVLTNNIKHQQDEDALLDKETEQLKIEIEKLNRELNRL